MMSIPIPFQVSQFHFDQVLKLERESQTITPHSIMSFGLTNPLVYCSISNIWSLKRIKIGRMERSKWNIWNSILTYALTDSCRSFTDGTLVCGYLKFTNPTVVLLYRDLILNFIGYWALGLLPIHQVELNAHGYLKKE